jgi:hypothetical protein
MPEFPQPDQIESQFRRLIEELIAGNMHRARFRPWEIEILLDIENCRLIGHSRRKILSEYQDAVLAQLATGSPALMQLSTFLALRNAESKNERKPRKAPAAEGGPEPKSGRLRNP